MSTCGGCVVALLLSASSALGAPGFPYQGQLHRNGAPQSGIYDLRFSLFTAPAGGTSLWTDTLSAVTVVAGVFSVKLGAGAVPITDNLLAQPDLYLEIEVKGATDSGFVKLAGRQQLMHVPSAATSAGDFRVRGKLTVGASADGGLLITDGGSSETVFGQLQVHAPGVSTLVVNGHSLQSNNTLQLQPSGGATTVGGTLTSGAHTAPNAWVKLYNNSIQLNASQELTVPVLAAPRVYRVIVQGMVTANTDSYMTLRVGGIATGYRTIFSWLGDDSNGQTNGNANGFYLVRNANNVASHVVGEFLVSQVTNSNFVALTGQYTQYDTVGGWVYAFTALGRVNIGSAASYTGLTFRMDANGSFNGNIQVYGSPTAGP